MVIEECRVYDAKGNLKKTHSPESLSKRFWKNGAGFDGMGIVTPPKEVRMDIVKKATQNWVCEECDKTFSATISRPYCHNPCTDPKESISRADKYLEPIPCKLCKEIFQPNVRKQIYCNDPCTTQKAKRKAVNATKTRICKQCKKSFKTEGKQKYCYNPCTRITRYASTHTRTVSTRLKLHESIDGKGSLVTVCGIKLPNKHLLAGKSKVTCKNCLRNKA